MHRRVAALRRDRRRPARRPAARRPSASRRRAGGWRGRRSALPHHASSWVHAKGDKSTTPPYMPATRPSRDSREPMLTTNPFDDDKLREECGIFGIWGADERRRASSRSASTRSSIAARKPPASPASTATHFHSPPGDGPCRRQFRPRRRHPQARRAAPRSAMSAIRPPARPRCATSSPCSPSLPTGGFAVAHNGNISNAMKLRARRSTGAARSSSRPATPRSSSTSSRPRPTATLLDRLIDALKQVEGAYSLVVPDRPRG